MNLSLHIKPEALHHAYLLVGEREATRDSLLDFIKGEIQFATKANPDFWFEEHGTVSIELARSISDFHIQRPFQGDRKMFVLVTNSITVEAQNALLKLFEEPIAGNHFFLIMGDGRTLLPTLCSRMQIITLSEAKDSKAGEIFIESGFTDRLKMVEDTIEEKDKERAKELMSSIISAIRLRAGNEKELQGVSQTLSQLIKNLDYLSDRAPSVKMILEHAIFTVPQYKKP